MENIKLDISKAIDFVDKEQLVKSKQSVPSYIEALHKKTGKGSDFLGWVNLPFNIKETEIKEITDTAKILQNKAQVIVVIGIGGSYLGAKAVIDMLSDNFNQLQQNWKNPLIVFAGHQLCEDYLFELRELLKQKEWAIIVISKSGNTTEPAVAFRILKQDLERRYGKVSTKDRIIAVTGKTGSSLYNVASHEGYRIFNIPDDVGGRFSVLTPVGLLPIAASGFDILKLIEGAQSMQKATGENIPVEENISALYAAIRNALYQKGKNIEILVNFHSKLHFFAEWWKQLYGESEGKEGKGIFPASVDFTSDLHSMGQYIQQGTRNIMETFISVKESRNTLLVPDDPENSGTLNFLSNRRISEINKNAELGTILAHIDGGVPVIKLEVPLLNEYSAGQLIYFFEKACGISGYMLGVNPFDQPGVESYKKNMFALLGKPGYEAMAYQLRKRLI